MDQRTDNSTNKALPWGVIAGLFGGMGFAMGLAAILVLCIGGPAYMDARARQLQAEMRTEFSERLAKAEAELDVAKYEASLAKTIAQRLDEKDKARR